MSAPDRFSGKVPCNTGAGADPGRHDNDPALLRSYLETGSEEAFEQFVKRHVDLVYSAALRRCAGNAHLAEEVAQSVFTSAARHANRLVHHPAISAWLYAATRNAALNLQVANQRRARREQEAAMSDSLSTSERTPDWNDVQRVLEEAMDELAPADQTAIILRFFERRSFPEIGAVLRASDNAVRMRTERALEKLRVALARRGVTSSAAALGSVLIYGAVGHAPRHVSRSVAATALRRTTIVTASRSSLLRTTLVVTGAIAMSVTTGILVYRPTLPALGRFNSPASAPGASAPAAKEGTPPPGVHRPPVVTSVVAVEASRRAPPTVGEPDIDAQRLLEKVGETYAALTSYQDSGEVLPLSKDKFWPEIRFRTMFARPGRLRFEWARPYPGSQTPAAQPPAMILSDGRDTIAYRGSGDHSEPQADVISAMAGSTVQTGGASFHIPRLFFPPDRQRRYFSLTDLQNPQLAGVQEFEGNACHVLKAHHLNGRAYELWIDRNDLLIRKIVTLTPVSPYASKDFPGVSPSMNVQITEVHRDIKTNAAIADPAFEIPKPPPPNAVAGP